MEIVVCRFCMKEHSFCTRRCILTSWGLKGGSSDALNNGRFKKMSYPTVANRKRTRCLPTVRVFAPQQLNLAFSAQPHRAMSVSIRKF